MKIFARCALALAAALLLLGGLSRWLDRPATVPGDVLEHDPGFQLTSAQTILPDDGLLTEVWTARSDVPAVASVTIDRLPRGHPLAISLSGHAKQPVRLVWIGGSQEVLLRNGDWQEIPLAISRGKNCGPLRIEASLGGPGEFVSTSRPYYTDFLHGATVRLFGRACTLGLTFLWIMILVTAAAALLQSTWLDLPVYLLPILGAATVALCGYALFWCYFAHPRLGDIAAVALESLPSGVGPAIIGLPRYGGMRRGRGPGSLCSRSDCSTSPCSTLGVVMPRGPGSPPLATAAARRRTICCRGSMRIACCKVWTRASSIRTG